MASDSFTYTFGAEEDCVYFAHDMLYHPANFADFCQKVEAWNRSDITCFGNYMHRTAGAELSFTLETPYFRASGCPFNPESARETGRCFAFASFLRLAD